MKYYGYNVNKIDHKEELAETDKEKWQEFLKNCRHKRYNYNTAETFKFLNHLNDGNIDIYKELLRGSYEVFKDDKYKIEREENNIYATDIEILEKNIPIVLGLYKFYDCPTIKDIFEFCIEKKQNRINYTKLNRIRKFVQIESNRRKRRLDFPVLKFVKESQQWARLHNKTTEIEINQYLANYAVKYANSIKDLVIDDKEYLELLFDLTKELWKVIILQSRPQKGIISISPFELLWEQKFDALNAYGGSELTRQFFAQELVEEMKDVEEEEIDDFIVTDKKRLQDISSELINVIHKPYGYYEYSEMDMSNERFMRKQENTNLLKDDIFAVKPIDVEDVNNEVQYDLFGNEVKK
jgi:hypothetical protein